MCRRMVIYCSVTYYRVLTGKINRPGSARCCSRGNYLLWDVVMNVV